MSFWSRLFGARESAEQKLARARAHLDDGEPMVALNLVAKLDGPEVDELRRRARELVEAIDQRAAARPPRSIEPDADDPLRAENQPADETPARPRGKPRDPRPHDGPYRAAAPRAKEPRRAPRPGGGDLLLHLDADGSMTIGSGADSITLNAPRSDDDGRPRSSSAVDVARRLLAATSEQPLDSRAFAFVEAALVLVRAGAPVPPPRDPKRRAVVELVRAAHTRDPAAVVAQLRAGTPAVEADLAHVATPLAIRFAARELGELALAGRVTPSWRLTEALLPLDPDLCTRIVEHVQSPRFGAETVLLAEQLGVAVPALAARWDEWHAALADPAAAGVLSVRRLALRDPDAALALATDLAREHGPDFGADRALATQLAKSDPARALATAQSREPHVDHAGWIAGLVSARVAGVGELVDTWIAALDRHTYDPWAYFAELFAACIELADSDRVRRCLAAAGPTGWQIACAGHHAIASPPDPDVRARLLIACYERVSPGVVAGRAIPFGEIPLGAGKMILQPAWLAFTDPHPVESLALPAALGGDAPAWA